MTQGESFHKVNHCLDLLLSLFRDWIPALNREQQVELKKYLCTRLGACLVRLEVCSLHPCSFKR